MRVLTKTRLSHLLVNTAGHSLWQQQMPTCQRQGILYRVQRLPQGLWLSGWEDTVTGGMKQNRRERHQPWNNKTNELVLVQLKRKKILQPCSLLFFCSVKKKSVRILFFYFLDSLFIMSEFATYLTAVAAYCDAKFYYKTGWARASWLAC